MIVAWDITSACNLSCIHCYNSRLYDRFYLQNLVRDLSTNEAFKILDKLAEGGADSIQFLGGEPFIRPDLIDLLAYTKDKKLNCRIATNGVLLDKTLIEELALICPEQIAFSIDGATAESNDAIRGKGMFDRAINNLRLLTSYFRDNRVKTRLCIECTLSKFNKHEIGKMVNLCKELNLDSIGFDPIQIHTRNTIQTNKLKQIVLDYFELFKVGEEIALLISSNQNKLEIKMPTLGVPRFRKYLNDQFNISLPVGRSCPAASDTFYIRADGIAHPCNYCCDFDENTFTQKVKKEELDLKVLSFEQVLDSEYFKTFYYFAHNGETYGKIDYCKKCEFYEICEPCPLDILEFGSKVASQCRKFEEHLKGKIETSREN